MAEMLIISHNNNQIDRHIARRRSPSYCKPFGQWNVWFTDMITFSFFYEELSELVHREHTDTGPSFRTGNIKICWNSLFATPDLIWMLHMTWFINMDTLNCETSVDTHVIPHISRRDAECWPLQISWYLFIKSQPP